MDTSLATPTPSNCAAANTKKAGSRTSENLPNSVIPTGAKRSGGTCFVFAPNLLNLPQLPVAYVVHKSAHRNRLRDPRMVVQLLQLLPHILFDILKGEKEC